MQIQSDPLRSTGQLTGSDGTMKLGGEDFSKHIADASEGGKSDMVYYLQLQQQMNAESRYFQTISNILKSRHDTASTAIRNIH